MDDRQTENQSCTEQEFPFLPFDDERINEPLHVYFERIARKFPDITAVKCGVETLTYHELNRRANQIGYEIRNQADLFGPS